MLRKSLTKKPSKNAVLDTITVVVVLFAFGLMSMFGWSIWGELEDDLRPELTSTAANDSLNVISNRYTATLDSLFIFVFIGIWITSLVASFMIDTHPIFFAVSLILLLFILVASIYIGNSYEEIMEDSDFSSLPSSFPSTHFILSHFLIVSIGVGTSIMVVLYGKLRT